MTHAEQNALQHRIKAQTDAIYSDIAQAVGPAFAHYQREAQVDRTRQSQS